MNADSITAGLTRHVLFYGEDTPPSKPVELRAGPLSLWFGQADLRCIRLGNDEVIWRIYVAVRDQYWNTVPARLSNLRIEASRNSFHITFDTEHTQDGIDFFWQGILDGNRAGTIRFVMEGEARSAFLTNRVGICVLHPIKECAGRPCAVEHVDGGIEKSVFPLLISPHQPFRRVRLISHEVLPGLSAQMLFEGDTFETEDQRNWTDTSYKTYCPPLEMPLPFKIEQGRRIAHAVTLTLRGTTAEAAEEIGIPCVSVAGKPSHPLPALGLGAATNGAQLSAKEIARLTSLHLAHLRVDLHLYRPEYLAALKEASADARALGASLEAALFVSDQASEELQDFVQRVAPLRPPVCRWLVFHINERSTSGKWIELARPHLASISRESQIGAGTNFYFAELNRKPPHPEGLDFVCFSINPQVHASDRATVVENLEAQASALESAQRLPGRLPVAVTPVTLKPRFNPNAVATEAMCVFDKLPASVDVRQMSLFAAGWTIGSMKYLAEQGALSLTYFETTGWLGVMERELKSPLSGVFRSLPGSVFPVYFVFYWLGEFAGGSVLPTATSQPQRVQAFGFCRNGKTRVLLANLAAAKTQARVDGPGASVKILRLNAENAVEAMLAPERFASLPGDLSALSGGGLTLELEPFEIVRIDLL